MMDSSTFKRFTASIENILDNLEDMDFTAFGKIILRYIYLPLNISSALNIFIYLCVYVSASSLVQIEALSVL